MGYRTLFYAAFFCAYACCLSSGTILPARAPSHGLVGSRTCLEKSRVGRNFQPLRGALCLCHDLGCVPSVCIPPSIFYQMAVAPWSGCRSCDWKTTQDRQRKSSYLNFTEIAGACSRMEYWFQLLHTHTHTPPWACIASFLPVPSPPSVPLSLSVTAGGIRRRSSVPVSPSSVFVTVLIAAPTVSVCRRMPSIVRHLVNW